MRKEVMALQFEDTLSTYRYLVCRFLRDLGAEECPKRRRNMKRYLDLYIDAVLDVQAMIDKRERR